MYRGVGSNLIGNSISWAMYFVLYDRLKAGLSTYHRTEQPLSFYDFFLASGVAGLFSRSFLQLKILTFWIGILTAVCTNPIWVVKTRMLSTSATYHGAYHSTFDGIRRIFHAEGLRGFYKGLSPSLFGVSHGAVQFMAYEQMKKHRSVQNDSDAGRRNITNLDYLTFSALSKVFAGTVTYPYQVVRARLQNYNAHKLYKGARDVMVQVWRQEGLKGFYKGLGPNLLRIVPSSCVTFLVYENTKFYLPRQFGVSRT